MNINERKLLPLLFNAYEFGSSGSAVLPTLFKLGKRLSDADYKKRIVPIITKLFASTDRMTRFRLLQQVNFFFYLFFFYFLGFLVRYLYRTFNSSCC